MASPSSIALLCLSLVLLSSVLSPCSAAVLKVGDTVGWTIGKIDYATWASKKTFHVGDTLVFVYNSSFHNVMEVKKADYDNCATTSPIAKYTTGNDSVAIKSKGDHYFFCGVPGHCQAGQKLMISALAKGSSAAPSMSPSPATAPSASPTTPTPSGTSGSSGGPTAPTPSTNSGNNNAPVTFKGLSLVVFTAAVVALMV